MPLPIKLETVLGDEPTEITQISSGSVTIGREPENGIVVDSVAVSRRHSCIQEAGDYWIYLDMGSTNGSWVNGVQVSENQIRLIRSGDILRVADLQMRVASVDEGAVEEPVALLVFQGDHFEFSVPLEDIGGEFRVGGAEGDILPDPDPTAESEVVIRNDNGRIELITGSAKTPVIVNGLAVGGTTVLVDRDQIGIGAYQLVVSDPRSAAMQAPARPEIIEHQGAIPTAYDRPNLPDHLRSSIQEDGWESEASRRRSQTGRKFVFGSEPEESSSSTFGPTDTMAMRADEVASKLRFETTPSQRFAADFSSDQGTERPQWVELLLIVLGVVVFGLVLGFGIYLLF